ncbi:hypothetical protein [Candidatus Brachybacter algidus]|uniref:hypothetical protein n=1 Tax=Candidatus Brachybacter algidus TaxID=2982024 RepID=UPI001B674050|nr:hypothetical protein [Candidatus Brachybacter algidus]MBK6450560.1 hypothetical protein [Candidatus Brachybacter algidus]MBP9844821.1 hypothetical protein [Saprospiraceae bacterium]
MEKLEYINCAKQAELDGYVLFLHRVWTRYLLCKDGLHTPTPVDRHTIDICRTKSGS